jgi:hypothetical protein
MRSHFVNLTDCAVLKLNKKLPVSTGPYFTAQLQKDISVKTL